MAKNKLVVFGDSGSFITKILYKQLLKEITNSSFEIVGVVNTTPFLLTNYITNILLFAIKKIFNPFDSKIIYNKYQTFLNDVDKQLLLESSNVNDNYFLDKIKKLNPDFAILIGCPQIFKSELINCFHKVINYHNSLLPKYRGLDATSWSMQYNEKDTGFSYHYVDSRVDTGNIIIQDKMEIDYKKSSFELEIEKTRLASKKLAELLDLISEGYEGTKQSGVNSYFGKREKDRLLTFRNLEDTKKMIALINIWGWVLLNDNDRTIIHITKMDNNGKIKRIKYLPPLVFYLYQTIKYAFMAKYGKHGK